MSVETIKDASASAMRIWRASGSTRRKSPGPSLSPIHPAGVHSCLLGKFQPERQAAMRFAANGLGVARVETKLILPGNVDQGDTAAFYEHLQYLVSVGFPCHFSHLAGLRRLQVRAQAWIWRIAGDHAASRR